MTGLFASRYDTGAPGAHIRRMAKARVAYWSARIVTRWLFAKPQEHPGERVMTRTVVQAGPVRLCREVSPDTMSTDVDVWLWPEHMLKMGRKCPKAAQTFARLDGRNALTQPHTPPAGVSRLARYIAVREAAAALGGRRG